MDRADIILQRAIAVDELIKQNKLKVYNLPIKHHPFIQTVRQWAMKEDKITAEQFNNNLGL